MSGCCMWIQGTFGLLKENRVPKLTRLYNAGLLILLIVAFCTTAWAFEDPLESLAIMSPQAVKSLLLDVAFSGNRVIAVGERGYIVYSDDQGQTWQQAQVPVQETLTVVTFPGAGQTGWVTGHSGLILVSHDSGKSWTKRLDGYQVNLLAVDAFTEAMIEKKAELASATEEDRKGLRNELGNLECMLSDAKASAKEGPAQPFLDIVFLNEYEGFAVGPFGLLVQTTDGGETWRCISPRIKNPDGFHYNAISAIDGDLFIAGESGFVCRSLDSGKSWEVLETPYKGSFFAVGGDRRSVMLLGLRGNAVVSSDKGESWNMVKSSTKNNLSSMLILSDGRFLVSQYGNNLLITDESRTQLMPLPWNIGAPISSMALCQDGSLITVGIGGVKHFSDPDFLAQVN